jgi:glycosyltransferase involved in cell wall biosynthesis
LKKVLIITYYWPPSGGSGVQRWLKFAKYLPQFGWEPIIYTPENPEANAVDPALVKDISPDTTILKTKIWEPYGIYKSLLGRGKKGGDKGDKPAEAKKITTATARIQANLISSGNTSLSHRISLWIRGNFFIPDPRCFWIKPSVKYLKEYLKKHPVDAIVSTGPPHSMHLIAKGIAQATGIKWIADFRDPWTEIFYFKHLKLSKYAYNKQRRLEQQVLDGADAVLVVSRQMQEDFAKRTSTPVKVITNGFDPDDFLPAEPHRDNATENQSTTRFSLIHTGIFVDNGNPDYLWEALGEKAKAEPQFKEDLEIRLMGQVDASVLEGIEKAGLQGNLINMGYVPHSTATMWQQKATALLLPLRKEPEAAAILTGKFFEYLASGAPILAFGPVEGDLAKALQETASGTIVDFEDKEGTRREIDTLYTEFLNGKRCGQRADEDVNGEKFVHISGSARKISPQAMKYSRKALTQKLAEILQQNSTL